MAIGIDLNFEREVVCFVESKHKQKKLRYLKGTLFFLMHNFNTGLANPHLCRLSKFGLNDYGE